MHSLGHTMDVAHCRRGSPRLDADVLRHCHFSRLRCDDALRRSGNTGGRKSFSGVCMRQSLGGATKFVLDLRCTLFEQAISTRVRNMRGREYPTFVEGRVYAKQEEVYNLRVS